MSKTLKEIHAAMQALEERFDNGKISEKIFEMRYSRLQEQLKHVQNSLEPQEHKVGIRSCSKLTALEQGISCLQLDVMDVVGHYRIIKELGRGGMGIVYKAEDIQFQDERFVALKVLPQHLSQMPEVLHDFKKEFITVSKLIHQNICGMYEFIENKKQELYCLVIEYLEGITLAKKLEEKRRYKLEEILPIVQQIATGLDFAHSKGVLHLDIKPGNIMINSEGNVKIMDFGLSQKMQDGKSYINLPSIFGTPVYVSPEQIQPGENNAVRPSTDLWSLAIIVYEMLKGSPPFQGSNILQLTHNIVMTEPAYIMGIPEYAQKAITQALSKDSKKRFDSCLDFYEALSSPPQVSLPVEQKNPSILATQINRRIRPSELLEEDTTGQRTIARQLPRQIVQIKRKKKMQQHFLKGLLFISIVFISMSISVVIFAKSSPIPENSTKEKTVLTKFVQHLKDNVVAVLPPNLKEKCWNQEKEIWDFTHDAWLKLSIEDQLQYASTYQVWYANYQALPMEKTFYRNGVELAMTLIPPGIFYMGSHENEEGRHEEEVMHVIAITKGFWMSTYEITQEQWQIIQRSNPSYFQNAGKNAAIENVSWEDAEQFCKKTNTKLPTEAQWEYACRGGIYGMTYLGDFTIISTNNAPELDYIAWYAGNSGVDYPGGQPSDSWMSCQYTSSFSGVHPVGKKLPSHWGLYDMLGNVCEWCQDWYAPYDITIKENPKGPDTGKIHVRRGGSWSNMAKVCRIANRSRWGSKLEFTGFRVIIEEISE